MEGAVNINYLVAFAFGLLSFFSPCVLPLFPGYLSLLASNSGGIAGETVAPGSGKTPRGRALINGLGFVLGFTAIFVAMGAAAGSLGRLLAEHQKAVSTMAGLIIIIFGLHISEIVPIKFFMRQLGGARANYLSGWPGAFLLGISFAAGWTPCVGPVLASILVLAGSTATMVQGMALLGLYALGLGVPFILAALGAQALQKWLGSFNKYLPYINAFSGGLLIAMGVLMILGLWNKVVLYFI